MRLLLFLTTEYAYLSLFLSIFSKTEDPCLFTFVINAVSSSSLYLWTRISFLSFSKTELVSSLALYNGINSLNLVIFFSYEGQPAETFSQAQFRLHDFKAFLIRFQYEINI